MVSELAVIGCIPLAHHPKPVIEIKDWSPADSTPSLRLFLALLVN
jgi:hypothetical protein